ncbi:MAG: hypothetical protein IKO91_00650 [Oscillospiraceae bacterium]|nr:hypothetical protein [Oscillospiraceae bacterium]
MIERFYNQFTPECDSCGKKLAGQESRRDALAALRRAGWEIDGDGFCTCADCLFELKGYEEEGR